MTFQMWLVKSLLVSLGCPRGSWCLFVASQLWRNLSEHLQVVLGTPPARRSSGNRSSSDRRAFSMLYASLCSDQIVLDWQYKKKGTFPTLMWFVKEFLMSKLALRRFSSIHHCQRKLSKKDLPVTVLAYKCE